MLLILFLLGCQSASTWDDASLTALASDPAQLRQTLQDLPVETQDLLLLTLAIRNPHQAKIFCSKTTSLAATEKCKQVIGRPHLQLSDPQQTDGTFKRSEQ